MIKIFDYDDEFLQKEYDNLAKLEKENTQIKNLMDFVSDLDLSVALWNKVNKLIESQTVESIDQFKNMIKNNEFSKFSGFGPKTLQELLELAEEKGW